MITSRMPWADYAAIDAVNITRLKRIERSPLHYKHYTPRETGALRLGKAAHCAVLEPERFDREYVAWRSFTDGGNLRPRNGKLWDAFVDAHPGREILTADEYDNAVTMRTAVRGDETALRYLASGDPEVTMEWTDGPHRCKGRVDWITDVDGVRVLVGLKTARDLRHFVFSNSAARLGYPQQWAYYRDGYEALTGTIAKVVEIVVEPEYPHAVATYVIPAEIIERGREIYREQFDLLAKCVEANHWPGPVDGEEILSMPSWFYREETDNDLSDLGLS